MHFSCFVFSLFIDCISPPPPPIIIFSLLSSCSSASCDIEKRVALAQRWADGVPRRFSVSLVTLSLELGHSTFSRSVSFFYGHSRPPSNFRFHVGCRRHCRHPFVSHSLCSMMDSLDDEALHRFIPRPSSLVDPSTAGHHSTPLNFKADRHHRLHQPFIANTDYASSSNVGMTEAVLRALADSTAPHLTHTDNPTSTSNGSDVACARY
ncbi:unnamed protein product [Soboliphyme baturini]|uniref:Secreted protein n=1 Tax=Soboliphyme baturini TaxID=241478 RepID=A0A183IHM1_9BILA|nr:unnamed protein product [Soboliphyme baturini]